MFAEVVECVLAENRHSVERSLDDLQGCHAQLWGELDNLTEAHKRESVKPSRRRIKKEIDLRWKDLKSLRVVISKHEGRVWDQPEQTTTSDDDLSDHGARDAAEAEMAITPGVDDATSGGTRTQFSDPPPVEEQTHSMEVDDCPPQLAPSPPGRMIY